MMQSTIQDIQEFYRLENNSFSFEIDDTQIKIKLDDIAEREIDQRLVIKKDNLTAWIETTIADNFFKIITYNRQSQTSAQFPLFGEPTTYGYNFFSFTWIDNSIICIYAGDHNYHYIHTITNNQSFKTFIRGDAVRIFEKFVTFQQYGVNEPVYKITIPELIIIDQFSEREAKNLNIMPVSLGLTYHSDHNFYYL